MRLTVEVGCGKGFPRDAIRAQLDLFGRLAGLFAAAVLPMASGREIPRRLGGEVARERRRVRIGDHPCLWFHAVSVGEVLLLRPLVREMARRRPNWEVVISTSTSTGLAVARRVYPDLVTFYAPLDFSWSTRRAIARIRPTVLALGRARAVAEPDPSRQTLRGQGRDHQRPPQLEELSRISQSAAPARSRLSAVSTSWPHRIRNTRGDSLIWELPSHRISVTGSVKYDGLESDRNNVQDARASPACSGLAPTDLVFVAGSTMEGEEAAVLAAYNTARRQHRGLRLILVPRHAERFEAVERAG